MWLGAPPDRCCPPAGPGDVIIGCGCRQRQPGYARVRTTVASGNVLAVPEKEPGVAGPAAGYARGRVPEVPALRIWPVIGGQSFSAISLCGGSGRCGSPVKITGCRPGRQIPQFTTIRTPRRDTRKLGLFRNAYLSTFALLVLQL
jgi:hypothetical protein